MRRLLDDFFQIAQLAGGAADFQLAGAVDDRDAGGVVAAILEFAQAFDDDGNDLFRADVADDSAHAGDLLKRLVKSVACEEMALSH